MTTAQPVRVLPAGHKDLDVTGWRGLVEDRLQQLLRSDTQIPCRDLIEAIGHSLLAPAKRLRALLVMCSASEWCDDPKIAIDCACALEMVHAASLILDDLPSMDDASLRRGRAANHVMFGESTAILAAISLLTEGFGVIARDGKLSAPVRTQMTALLSEALGVNGLAAGQYADLHRQRSSAIGAFEEIHAYKTGALFAAAAKGGGLIGGIDPARLAALEDFGMALGMAFQAFDDVIDLVGTTHDTGKNVGQDDEQGSLVHRLDLDGAKAKMYAHIARAEAIAEDLSPTHGPLHQYTVYLRDKLNHYLVPSGLA